MEWREGKLVLKLSLDRERFPNGIQGHIECQILTLQQNVSKVSRKFSKVFKIDITDVDDHVPVLTSDDVIHSPQYLKVII